MNQPPDPYGEGQEATQPAPSDPQQQPYGQQYAQQPYGQQYAQQPYGQQYAQPPPSYPQAPPVLAPYGYGQYGAEVVPQGLYRDDVSGLLLPQGTQLASNGRRIGAYFLSGLLAFVTLGIGYVIWGLIAWGNGQTPALQVLGMRCWHLDTKSVPGWGKMAQREVVGVFLVEGLLAWVTLAVLPIVSFILMLTGRERMPLHDKVAGTVVLHDPNKVLSPPQPR